MVPISSEETMPATLGRLRDGPRAAAGADARPLHCGGVDGDLNLGGPAAAEVQLEAGWNCDDEHIMSTIHVAGGVAGRYEIGALELRRIDRRDQLLGELRLVLAAESRHQSKSPSTNFTEFVKLDLREATSFSRLVRCTFASAAWRGPRTLIRRTSSHSNRAGS